jgi:hypothetical protein
MGGNSDIARVLSRIASASRRGAAIAVAVAVLVVLGVLLGLVLGGGSPARHAARPAAPATGTAPRPALPPPASELIGVSVNRLFNAGGYTAAQIDAQLAALQQTGATLARSDALWEAAEPAPPVAGTHRYDWSFADRIAGALAAHGLRWLPIIDYSAPWAQSIPGQDHSPPTSSAAYAAYAAALAQRYGTGGSFWQSHPEVQPEPVDTYEIWNEPDNPAFWSPSPDAGAYADLYAGARAAIDAVQPGARVIVGGLTHPRSFLAEVLAADPALRGQIDGVAIHPYGRTPERILHSVGGARLELDTLGMPGVPLYITELGWTTRPPGALDYLPGRLRPGYIERTIAELGHVNCGIAATILYTWVTPERNPADAQDWFGIHPPDGASSPDAEAFAAGIRAATAPAPAIPLCGG